jgi:phage terminase large subunit-like protein
MADTSNKKDQADSNMESASESEPVWSPLRPSMPRQMAPPEPLRPHLPERPDGNDEMDEAYIQAHAENALEHLRQKIAAIAAEYAAGKINRAQFNAIYARYTEQRQIAERLLERNPETEAWRSVLREGHTGFLRNRFQAKFLSYVVYDNNPPLQDGVFRPLMAHGEEFSLPRMTLYLRSFYEAMRKEADVKVRLAPFDEKGAYLTIISGAYTTAAIIFSLEPSKNQINWAQDLHRDFERANVEALSQDIRNPEHLVFPQRALFV